MVRFWVCQTLVLQATSRKYLPANVGRIWSLPASTVQVRILMDNKTHEMAICCKRFNTSLISKPLLGQNQEMAIFCKGDWTLKSFKHHKCTWKWGRSGVARNWVTWSDNQVMKKNPKSCETGSYIGQLISFGTCLQYQLKLSWKSFKPFKTFNLLSVFSSSTHQQPSSSTHHQHHLKWVVFSI